MLKGWSTIAHNKAQREDAQAQREEYSEKLKKKQFTLAKFAKWS
jgi:hypothetical protein